MQKNHVQRAVKAACPLRCDLAANADKPYLLAVAEEGCGTSSHRRIAELEGLCQACSTSTPTWRRHCKLTLWHWFRRRCGGLRECVSKTCVQLGTPTLRADKLTPCDGNDSTVHWLRPSKGCAATAASRCLQTLRYYACGKRV